MCLSPPEIMCSLNITFWNNDKTDEVLSLCVRLSSDRDENASSVVKELGLFNVCFSKCLQHNRELTAISTSAQVKALPLSASASCYLLNLILRKKGANNFETLSHQWKEPDMKEVQKWIECCAVDVFFPLCCPYIVRPVALSLLLPLFLSRSLAHSISFAERLAWVIHHCALSKAFSTTWWEQCACDWDWEAQIER